MGAVTDGEALSPPPRPAPRNRAASPAPAAASLETPGLPRRFREPLGFPDRVPRRPGLSRPLPPSSSASPRSPPCPPMAPLGLPGRLSRDRAGRGAGALGGSSGGREHTWGPEQAGSQRCAGGWYPEGVQAVGGCGEGALGGGAGVRGAAKGKKGWRPCRWGSGGPKEGLEEGELRRGGRGVGWRSRQVGKLGEVSGQYCRGVGVQRVNPGKCLGRSPRQWIARRPGS